MKLNKGIIPPNNFHFPADKNVILKASTYDLLIKEIVNWRTQNGIPIGDPEGDVDNYFCGKWPSYCYISENESSAVTKNSNMLKQVNAWAAIATRDTLSLIHI